MDNSSDNLFFQALQSQIPNLKTQAQLNAFMASFDALRLVLDATFAGDTLAAETAKGALMQALDVAEKVTTIGQSLRDVPEAAVGPQASQFVQPPQQFHEHDVQRELLAQLSRIPDKATLEEWYTATKSRRDTIVSASLRNVLYDAIRDKRNSFLGATP